MLTSNLPRAMENLSKHQPVGGNISLVLVEETLLPAQKGALSNVIPGLAFPQGKVVNSLEKIPQDSNTVVIVAKNNPLDKETFLNQLDVAGEEGKLKDKFIVLQRCGEGEAEIEVANKILGYGVSGVFFFSEKISINPLLLNFYLIMKELLN